MSKADIAYNVAIDMVDNMLGTERHKEFLIQAIVTLYEIAEKDIPND